MADRRVLTEPDLPSYAPMMADYHQAFAEDLKALVGSLALAANSRVVDLACGDGTYSRWFAEAVGDEGGVLAVDVSTDFLAEAERFVKDEAPDAAHRVSFVRADLDQPTLVEGEADLVWCAQSLYSLPDPVSAVERMRRLSRPGGRVVVFESDEFHHLTLPWPIDLEIAIKRAELDSFEAQADDASKYYVGRNLATVFRKAGLPDCAIRGVAFHRQAPLDEAARAFVLAYLEDLKTRAADHLAPSDRERFEELIDPRSDRFLLAGEDFGFTCLEYLAEARTPDLEPKSRRRTA